MRKIFFNSIIFLIIVLNSCSPDESNNRRTPFKEELNSKISRGLSIFDQESGDAFLTWRKLPSDPINCSYYIWKQIIDNNDTTIINLSQTNSTSLIDLNNSDLKNISYSISIDSSIYSLEWIEANYDNVIDGDRLVFNLNEDYKQAHIVTGDLTGDGEFEVLINYSKMKAIDPYEKAWMKSEDSFHLHAYTKGGKLLWVFELGFGIEAGKNYSPVVVWDLDADGKCEVLLKTNKSDDPKSYKDEYLTILSGETGKILRETRWPEPPSEQYNSNSRNYIAIAHLNGIDPSIIIGRGNYHEQVLCAFDSDLNKLWERNLGIDIEPMFNNQYLRKIWKVFSNDQSRGSHSLPIADVNEDGKEEIFWGEHTISENGEDLWEVTEQTPYKGHLDIIYPADIYPNLPGKETFYTREGWYGKESPNIGMLVVDKNGKTIWSEWNYSHVDGGWASKIIPGTNYMQFFGYDVEMKKWKPGELSFNETSQHVLDSLGNIMAHKDSSWIGSFTLDWEGDDVKEICTKDGNLQRYNNELIASFGEGIQWAGDIFGDHREEIIYAPKDGKVYIIFNTTLLKTVPKIARIADRQYRNDLSRTAMQFNVIPTESNYIPKLDVK